MVDQRGVRPEVGHPLVRSKIMLDLLIGQTDTSTYWMFLTDAGVGMDSNQPANVRTKAAKVPKCTGCSINSFSTGKNDGQLRKSWIRLSGGLKARRRRWQQKTRTTHCKARQSRLTFLTVRRVSGPCYYCACLSSTRSVDTAFGLLSARAAELLRDQ
jgi:hypothetical protein